MSGFRGYVCSRPIFGGDRAPQHVQNIVLRDYARRKELTYLLSAVEYTMPGCFQMFETLLDELPRLDGVLCYSLFMLPDDDAKRITFYNKILSAGKSIHFAVEDFVISNLSDVARAEDIWLTKKLTLLQSTSPHLISIADR